ncbi:MAG TPA: hypothetical protein VJS14_06545 [Enterobacteriaceae bacterium]|nr:hypothetical protein [Enterobacteriaceae bacterium]
MLNALNSSRSVQTIRDCTNMIATVPLRHRDDALQIRHLKSEGALRDQHFIITVRSDVNEATFSVKPFAELIVLNDHLRFVVLPETQYPEITSSEDEIFSEIERNLAQFLKSKYSVDVSLTRNESSVKRRVANQWDHR